MRTSDQDINSGAQGRAPSFDDALAAYAQFICLRLSVSRCLVSCFDRNHQYILAEATPTLSLTTHKADDPNDELWMGSCVQKRYTHLCELTLEFADKKADKDHDGVVVLPNIADNDWYKKRKSLISLPDRVCFYAGTAIRSPFGPVIGVITVLDDKPREGLSQEDKRFLQHMSDTTMTHLDMVRSKEEHRRTSRMVLGLGSFVEGKGHVDMNLHNKDLPKSTVIEHQGERPLTPGASAPKPPEMEDIEQNNPPLNPKDTNNADDALNFENLQAQMLSTDVKSTFQRAAGIIKEAIDVEGVVFLDASVGSFGALVQSVPAISENDTASYFSRNSSSNKECHVLGSAGESDPGFSITEGFLHSFLTRYGQGRIFNIDPKDNELHAKNPQTPEESEDFGQKVEPMEEQHSDAESREQVRRQRQADLDRLRRLFPDARSLAFVPMWYVYEGTDSHIRSMLIRSLRCRDDHRMRWFCGGFIWSNKAIRLLHKDSELSFLRAFGMSIMSEVAKLDTAMADRAKSDLLNSISHELRSPLHGILGSIECLESTDLDPMQHGLVETVDTCGRTLLDTINHLLDFSKINNFTRNKTKRQKNSESRQADMLSLDSTVHLPTITEEALETVFAGYSSAGFREAANSSQESKNSTPNRNVEVIVDIEAKDHENWLLRTEGGAWKRLVMNLVSHLTCSYTDNILILFADWQQFEVHK
jgi:signal transduction histidine kinase